ncbi:hypothetical protein RF11_07619 [Thelohanellus kitauei]|uniref:Uncharacterized protein n=1 Tax=Thelohanellus kitauei TaxID=669202 RepID=A0A0C2NFR6_THEKT|nr:hypothetical protein RF11_07619 [Thelohanellus kitauei]
MKKPTLFFFLLIFQTAYSQTKGPNTCYIDAFNKDTTVALYSHVVGVGAPSYLYLKANENGYHLESYPHGSCNHTLPINYGNEANGFANVYISISLFKNAKPFASQQISLDVPFSENFVNLAYGEKIMDLYVDLKHDGSTLLPVSNNHNYLPYLPRSYSSGKGLDCAGLYYDGVYSVLKLTTKDNEYYYPSQHFSLIIEVKPEGDLPDDFSCKSITLHGWRARCEGPYNSRKPPVTNLVVPDNWGNIIMKFRLEDPFNLRRNKTARYSYSNGKLERVPEAHPSLQISNLKVVPYSSLSWSQLPGPNHIILGIYSEHTTTCSTISVQLYMRRVVYVDPVGYTNHLVASQSWEIPKISKYRHFSKRMEATSQTLRMCGVPVTVSGLPQQ